METLQATQIAIKNILFATDFEAPASRALPFAVAMATRYGARLYVSHVIPQEAYACASPQAVDRVLKEAGEFAAYTLSQIVGPLKQRGLRCDAALGEGNITEVLKDFGRKYSADVVVVGRSCARWSKAVLGSVAEEIIRELPCPVLTVGPLVTTLASSGVQCIICATDFSPAATHAMEFAISLAEEYRAHLTLLHVLEGRLPTTPQFAVESAERRLRQALPIEVDLRFKPEIVVETGSVADCIVSLTGELSADIIVMGACGAGSLAQWASHFGSMAHKVISLASCPVLTVGDVQRSECR